MRDVDFRYKIGQCNPNYEKGIREARKKRSTKRKTSTASSVDACYKRNESELPDSSRWLWSPAPLRPRPEGGETIPSDLRHRRVRPRSPPPGSRCFRPAASWQSERPG